MTVLQFHYLKEKESKSLEIHRCKFFKNKVKQEKMRRVHFLKNSKCFSTETLGNFFKVRKQEVGFAKDQKTNFMCDSV